MDTTVVVWTIRFRPRRPRGRLREVCHVRKARLARLHGADTVLPMGTVVEASFLQCSRALVTIEDAVDGLHLHVITETDGAQAAIIVAAARDGSAPQIMVTWMKSHTLNLMRMVTRIL